ncbi:MAG: hypothetical protein AMXMBFR23_09990 [Chloroflexota bacterium]
MQSAFSDVRTEWEAFQGRLRRSSQSRTTLTREWMTHFLEVLGFRRLTYQPAALEAGGERYSISHLNGDEEIAPPLHIVALDQQLDQRDGRRSPHSSVQEYLNRSGVLWGVVTNGRRLRLLRDSERFTRPSYVEFDIEGIIEGNQYPEFVLLYRLLHASRFPNGDAAAHECLLETYYTQGIEHGGRVRERLRDGVETALRELGQAFLVHPESEGLRRAFEEGNLDADEYYRELLRLVYRLLFLMVAEERRLIFPDGADEARATIYQRYYSVSSLRERVERYSDRDQNQDLWLGLVQTFRLFRDDATASRLSLSALDGELFGPLACRHLEGAHCSNEALLRALWGLSLFRDESKALRRVNYAAINVEEFGSIYESLLDFQPDVALAPDPRFDLLGGTERKQTGSYYTPPELVQELINSALVPVMTERVEAARTREAKEQALLDLRVIDPASGSGHFMLAAARRIATELVRVRAGEDEPSPQAFREAMRDVIRHCIYAVDKNPLAVDLCKVALWIEGHAPGLPLSFLDHHVKCGDSLVGVFDLKVLEDGIPDAAYTASTGDDKSAATAYRKRNREERQQASEGFQLGLGERSDMALPESLAERFEALGGLDERTPDEVHEKERLYQSLRSGEQWWTYKTACDLWTAAFFAPLRKGESGQVPTTRIVRHALREPKALDGRMVGAASGESTRLRFFHWPLEFPDVLIRHGGFDVVLGNPPWERMKLQEQEFFGSRDREIATAANKAARERLLKTLPARKPELHRDFEQTKRDAEGASLFVRGSERFPLAGRGDVNTYTVFCETNRMLLHSAGRAGMIIPSGIATDDTTKYLFGDLIERRALISLHSFENEAKIFPAVHNETKFCLLTIGGLETGWIEPDFVFFARHVSDLREPARHFTLTAEDFTLLNPNTRTCPIFRSGREAAITKAIYRRIPVLVDESKDEVGNPWGVHFMAMFHMSGDSNLFLTREELRASGRWLEGMAFRSGDEVAVPLYEGKMIWQFDHRFGTYDGQTQAQANKGFLPQFTDTDHANPVVLPEPRYWIPENDVALRLEGRWGRGWFIVWRDISLATNERTVVSTVAPRSGAGHTMPLLLLSPESAPHAGSLVGNLAAFVLDFVARQKVGGTHLTYGYLRQFAVLAPEVYQAKCPWDRELTTGTWLTQRVQELTYTAWDLQDFAHDCGYGGPPFQWDAERRSLLRCEIDAAFFHLYAIGRDDVDYIMDTFPIVRRNDEREHGEYRTKRVILEVYDRIARGMQTGEAYQTLLDPPPADPSVAHSADTRPEWARKD